MELLVCITQDSHDAFVLEYGAWLAGQLGIDVTLLAAVEQPADEAAALGVLAAAEESLRSAGVGVAQQVVRAHREAAIAEQARPGRLVVFGPREIPALQRLVRGRARARLLDAIETPLLYVPVANLRLRRILVGLGGIGLADTLVAYVAWIASRTGAAVTLLHTQPPSSYEYPGAELQPDWPALRDSGAPQARHIQSALDRLVAAGIETNVVIRHGYPVNMLLHELHEGAYDLLGLGSHHSAAGLRPRFTPDVARQVLAGAELPVLVVRHGAAEPPAPGA